MAYKDPSDPRLLEKRREHYRNNKEAYLNRNKVRKQEMRDHIKSVKSVPCQDCGRSFPSYVMDFDHRDPSVKTDFVGKFVQAGSWDKLLEEIAKCDVVCANCHRIRTHRPDKV